MPQLVVRQSCTTIQLNLFDMGGMMAPKMFLTTVLKRSDGGSGNFVTFNINLWSIKKVIFGFLGYQVLP